MDRRLVRRIVALGAGAFLLGYLAVAFVMFLTSSHKEIVTVPDVRRLTLAQARSVLREADLGLEVGDSLPNPRVAAGAVVAQSPLPGGEVGPRTAVRVILSAGRERRAVPVVTVMSELQAVSLLRAMGFQVAVERVSSMRAEGRVVGTIPAAASRVAVPSPLRLLVSAGPPLVAVPALDSLTEAAAGAALEAAGLELGRIEREYHPEAQDGVVLSQTPAAGDTVRQGTRVDLVVSSREIRGLEPNVIH